MPRVIFQLAHFASSSRVCNTHFEVFADRAKKAQLEQNVGNLGA